MRNLGRVRLSSVFRDTSEPQRRPKLSIDIVSVFGTGNASVRARLFEPMQRLGVDHRLHAYFAPAVTVRSGLRDCPLSVPMSELRLRRLAAAGPDVLFLNREASPFSRGGIESELLSRASMGVLDLDDALHLDVRPDVASRLFPKPLKVERAARTADVVLAGNGVLADWASSFADDVRVIPTCVDVWRYRSKASYDMFDPPRFVWLGTRSGERYLEDVALALQAVHRLNGARLTIIGDPAAPTPVGLDDMIDRVAWRPGLPEESLADFDIGLMPLRDTPYERGKCAYKLLEYGAAGLPTLASPVGINRTILADSGIPAPASLGEWTEALLELVTSTTAQREQRGMALQRTVKRGFDYGAWLPEWQRIVGARDANTSP
jgi:glycosyltransferase involved in cell wall biosynthesis